MESAARVAFSAWSSSEPGKPKTATIPRPSRVSCRSTRPEERSVAWRMNFCGDIGENDGSTFVRQVMLVRNVADDCGSFVHSSAPLEQARR